MIGGQLTSSLPAPGLDLLLGDRIPSNLQSATFTTNHFIRRIEDMTTDQIASDGLTRQFRSLDDLPDDILLDIARLLEAKSDEQSSELVAPTYETPRPFLGPFADQRRSCSRPASLPGRIRIGADVRALRVVCRRTAEALSLGYLTRLTLKIETMADVAAVREAPHTIRMAAR